MKRRKILQTKRGRKKRAEDGTETVNAMPLPDERAVWPAEEKLLHRISKESDQEIREHRLEHSILEQSRQERK